MTTIQRQQLSVDEQLAIIKRGAEKILPDEAALRARLEHAAKERRPLRVKLGIDGTFTDLTLGHSIPLRNLRRFQDLGHQAVLVIGDYTATVGDPSGRSKARPPLTHEEVLANVTTYQEQAGRIIDLERAEVVWNSTWLKELTFKELIRIGSRVSVKRMLEGEYFGRRMDDPDQTVFMHEMFYPIMQGMDSVAIRADVELGGTDQEFNCLMGRDMQRLYEQEPQLVLTNPLLLGLSGADKMSKSLGNFVGVAWPAQEQFNKLMMMADDRMREYYRLLTDVPMGEVEAKLRDVAAGELDPRQVKKELVTAIVAGFHGEEAARQAAVEYERYADLSRTRGSTKELPDNIASFDMDQYLQIEGRVPTEDIRLVTLLVQAGFAKSSAEAKRLIKQRGVTLNGAIVDDINFELRAEEWRNKLLLVGKRDPLLLK